MKTIIMILFLGLTACGGTPLTYTSALSKNQLWLELVAKDSNAYSYQLRLCRGNSATNACRVALLDAQGNAAIIYPFELQRLSYFDTYKGYAIVALALVAAPLVGFKVWRKLIRKADGVLEAGRSAVQRQKLDYKQQGERLRTEIAEQIETADDDLRDALQQIKGEKNAAFKAIEDEEIMPQINKALGKETLPFYIKAMKKDLAAGIDSIVADKQSSLTRGIHFEQHNLAQLEISGKAEKRKIRKSIEELAGEIEEFDGSIAAKLDADVLQVDFNKQDLAKLDNVFIERLALRKSSFQLGDDGIEFFQTKTYIESSTLNILETLRFLERKKQLLEQVKDGHTLDIKKLKAELHELNEPVTKFFANRQMLNRYYEVFPEDKFLFEQLASVSDETYVPGMLLRADVIRDSYNSIASKGEMYRALNGQEIYRVALKHLLEIRVKEESIDLAGKIKNNNLDIDAVLTQVYNDIDQLKEDFFVNVIDQDLLPKTNNNDLSSFEQRLLSLDLNSPPPSQEIAAKRDNIAAMKDSLVRNREDIEVASTKITSLQQELEALPQKTAKLKQHITGWEKKLAQVQTKAATQKKQAQDLHQRSLAELEQRQLALQEQEAKDLRELVEEGETLATQHNKSTGKAKVNGVATSAGLLGAAATFDQLVWGSTARQQSRHWQKLSDAHAITVTDVAEAKKILHSIATISGFSINPQALGLLD